MRLEDRRREVKEEYGRMRKVIVEVFKSAVFSSAVGRSVSNSGEMD